MKKPSRRLLLIIGAAVVLLAVLAGAALFISSRSVTSYGTASEAKNYAPAVAKMVSSQQKVADSLQAFFEQQSDDYSDVQQNFDHQSAQATSPLKQWLGPAVCPIGQVQYTDVLNVSVTLVDGQDLDVPKLLKQATTATSGKLTDSSIRFKDPNFRIDVSSVSAADRYTLRLTIPNLQDSADRAAAACYPVAQVPLSSVQQLG